MFINVSCSLRLSGWLIFGILILLCQESVSANSNQDSSFFAAEASHGERLFLETRFAQRFYKFLQKGGKVNESIDVGDPVLNKTVRFFGLPPYQIPFAAGPFKHKSFNCRACHLVDEHVSQKELGMRTYVDFASRSPVPHREDDLLVTARNSPTLVSITAPRQNIVLHVDGEFSSLQHVIVATLTGRNLGWLPGEYQQATDHICEIIRKDDGRGELASDFDAHPYAEIFSGKTSKGELISRGYLIAEDKRINVHKSSCKEIVQLTATLINQYIQDLAFAKDEDILSPYDTFLEVNGLPNKPEKNESNQEYSQRLMKIIHVLEKNKKLRYVNKNPHTDDGGFRFHDQAFVFSGQQLAGMKIFFNRNPAGQSGTGNCIACHVAPQFTDFGLHNVGVTQVEYEAIHGVGAFNKLLIPNNEQRQRHAQQYLPATNNHPEREGIFRRPASEHNPAHTDLGAWNIFLNDDYPLPQQALRNLICTSTASCETNDQALQLSIGKFKTPTLRDLGHSAPYMHNGQISDLHAVIGYYLVASNNSREGYLRNIDEELKKMRIAPADIQPLVSFLISLYEDYH